MLKWEECCNDYFFPSLLSLSGLTRVTEVSLLTKNSQNKNKLQRTNVFMNSEEWLNLTPYWLLLYQLLTPCSSSCFALFAHKYILYYTGLNSYMYFWRTLHADTSDSLKWNAPHSRIWHTPDACLKEAVLESLFISPETAKMPYSCRTLQEGASKSLQALN